jgi:hypothetical protein
MLDGRTTSAPIAAGNTLYCHDFPANEEYFLFGSQVARYR